MGASVSIQRSLLLFSINCSEDLQKTNLWINAPTADATGSAGQISAAVGRAGAISRKNKLNTGELSQAVSLFRAE